MRRTRSSGFVFFERMARMFAERVGEGAVNVSLSGHTGRDFVQVGPIGYPQRSASVLQPSSG